MAKFFKNIVGTINASELDFFKPNTHLTKESAKYFIIKKDLKENRYNILVYSEGIIAITDEYCKKPQYLSCVCNTYIESLNGDEFFATTKVLEVNIDN